MKTEEDRLRPVTETIIGCAFRVVNALGCGFLEKVYERALTHEIRRAGLEVKEQPAIEVWYDGVKVGDYVADLFVAGEVLIELKAVKALDETHLAQCMNYLKATGLKICLLINFGRPKVWIKRVVNRL